MVAGAFGDCRLQNPSIHRPWLNPSGAHFSQWRERRISDDDWRYSIAVGSQTIEVLQKMFGAVGFRGPGQSRSWQDPKAATHSLHESHHVGPGTGCLRVSIEAQQYAFQGPLGVQPHRLQPGMARPAWVPYGPREKDERARGYEDHSPFSHLTIGTGQVPPVLGHWDPPAVRATSNGSPEKVALFISRY